MIKARESIIPESTIIGQNVVVNCDSFILGENCFIGNDVRIGPYTVMRAANHRFDAIDLPLYKQGHDSGQIIVEDDVWLGAHVTLLPNIKIGKSSIIGAGSVVTSDIPHFL